MTVETKLSDADVRRERKRQTNAAWRKANPEKVLASVERWKQKNRKKRLAHARVRNALEDGRLTKEPCERCGDEKVHGHHDDYSKPLDVRWLCPLHHKERHRELAAIDSERDK